MIQRFPILEYLYARAGVYSIDGSERAIHLRKAGYGFSIQIDDAVPARTVYGVIGVSGSDLELHTNIGLANVLVFKWAHNFENVAGRDIKIDFKNDDLSIHMAIEFNGDEIEFSFISNDIIKKSIVGKRAA